MATLRINNILASSFSDYLIFSHIPNIVTVESTGVITYQKMELDYSGLYVNPNIQHYFRIGDFTVYSTNVFNENDNRTFYIGGSNDSTIHNLIKVLRNIPQIDMNYNFNINENTESFTITSKNEKLLGTMQVSNNMGIGIDRNVPGANTDQLVGRKETKVFVELYYNPNNAKINQSATNVDNLSLLTTLEKTYYKNSVSFDITPVISTIAEYGVGKEIYIKTYAIVDGNYASVGEISKVYITKGYESNVINRYLPIINYEMDNSVRLLTTNRDMYLDDANNADTNASKIWLYSPYSVYASIISSEVTAFNITIIYYNSDGSIITSTAHNNRYDGNIQSLYNNTGRNFINFDATNFKKASYIIVKHNNGTEDPSFYMRFDVIHPPYNVEKHLRVYWYNEIGGISQTDFVGELITTDKASSTTYKENNLNYYNSNRKGEIIYSNDTEKTYSITSHIVSKNDLETYRSLLNSYNVWDLNPYGNTKRTIIITNMTFEKQGEDAYVVHLEFKYGKN